MQVSSGHSSLEKERNIEKASMKPFSWHCPKCETFNTVDLSGSEPAELTCEKCRWTIGKDAPEDPPRTKPARPV